MNKTNHVKSNKKGFTLIELLIAMAISGIVAGAIFTAFQSQQKSYLVQEQVAEMQQNLRAGMDLMVREIRMAGYDPTGDASTQIEKAEPDLIYLTKDANSDGDFSDSGEHIVFDSYPTSGIEKLGRTTSNSTITVTESPAGSSHFEATGHQPLAENIEALGFAYAFDANGDGILDTYNVGGNQQVIWAVDSDGDNDLDRNLDTNGDGNIDENDGPGPGGNGLIGGTAITTDVVPQDIRAVRIWMLARTEHGDNSFLNTKTYTVGNKVITPNTDADPNNDNLRMRLLETIVKCRNMGL